MAILNSRKMISIPGQGHYGGVNSVQNVGVHARDGQNLQVTRESYDSLVILWPGEKVLPKGHNVRASLLLLGHLVRGNHVFVAVIWFASIHIKRRERGGGVP